ncbi:MAG: uracil-DNA glycosylase family protein [Hyphomicrobiaceae bacterium]
MCRDEPKGKPLPHEPRPVLVASSTARICICGQAPGTRVHASGRPFTDPSGDRLREWMGISEEIFYDPDRVAIIPMGFCFPGLDAKGGDLPPRKECAPLWREKVFGAMPQLELVLLVGLYAQKWHLGKKAHTSLTATVTDWRSIYDPDASPRFLPTPHPSWRNNAWLKRHPWFEAKLLPVLRSDVASLVG